MIIYSCAVHFFLLSSSLCSTTLDATRGKDSPQSSMWVVTTYLVSNLMHRVALSADQSLSAFHHIPAVTISHLLSAWTTGTHAYWSLLPATRRRDSLALSQPTGGSGQRAGYQSLHTRPLFRLTASYEDDVLRMFRTSIHMHATSELTAIRIR